MDITNLPLQRYFNLLYIINVNKFAEVSCCGASFFVIWAGKWMSKYGSRVKLQTHFFTRQYKPCNNPILLNRLIQQHHSKKHHRKHNRIC
ncbi:hypothetical protein Hanom_Chr04g00300111 [Helianthus anomalus]